MTLNDKTAMPANTETSVTDEKIEALIYSEHYFTAADGVAGATDSSRVLPASPLDLLTFCVLILHNGFTITGKSACADPANFDRDKGEYWARKDAIKQIWPLEGYLLRQRLHEGKATSQ